VSRWVKLNIALRSIPSALCLPPLPTFNVMMCILVMDSGSIKKNGSTMNLMLICDLFMGGWKNSLYVVEI
jgi:hypothetical protein